MIHWREQWALFVMITNPFLPFPQSPGQKGLSFKHLKCRVKLFLIL